MADKDDGKHLADASSASEPPSFNMGVGSAMTALKRGITMTKMAAAGMVEATPTVAIARRPVVKDDDGRRLQQAIDEKIMAQNEITRLSGLLAEQMAEREAGRAAIQKVQGIEDELNRLRAETSRTKERIEYRKIEANELEIQATREQSAALKAELAKLKDDLAAANNNVSALTLARTELETQLQLSRKACAQAQSAQATASDEAARAGALVDGLRAKLAEAVATRDEFQRKLDMSREAVNLEVQRDKDKWHAKWSEKEKQFFLELDAANAERNALRAKAESLQKELEKTRRRQAGIAAEEQKKWAEEKAGLLEQLERRSKSLEDAMEALRTKDPAKRAMAALMMETQRRLPQLSTADVKVIEQNHAFQSIAQNLLETVKDRDALIEQLRQDHAALGRRVIELDEALRRAGATAPTSPPSQLP
ncbi:Uncharacterized protein PBTT_03116 [Plasmodiophora brassicae]